MAKVDKNQMAPQVRELKIRNKYGIHARPAAMFVKTAGSYDAEVTVEKEGMKVSGKSIMGLLTLEGYKGCVLRVSAEGPDACEALDALQDLIDNNFFED